MSGFLIDKWWEYKKKLDINVTELEKLKNRLSESRKISEQLKLEKASLQTKSNQIELELKEKCLNLETSIKKSQETHRNEISLNIVQLGRARKELGNLRNFFSHKKSKF